MNTVPVIQQSKPKYQYKDPVISSDSDLNEWLSLEEIVDQKIRLELESQKKILKKTTLTWKDVANIDSTFHLNSAEDTSHTVMNMLYDIGYRYFCYLDNVCEFVLARSGELRWKEIKELKEEDINVIL